MKEDAKLRVRRLTAWIRRRKRDLLDEKGEISTAELAKATGKVQGYWSDVLGMREGKSFAAAAARQAEDALKIPPMHLDGGGWPFDDIDFDRFDRLSEKHKGRVETAVLREIEEIEALLAEQANRANGTTGK